MINNQPYCWKVTPSGCMPMGIYINNVDFLYVYTQCKMHLNSNYKISKSLITTDCMCQSSHVSNNDVASLCQFYVIEYTYKSFFSQVTPKVPPNKIKCCLKYTQGVSF